MPRRVDLLVVGAAAGYVLLTGWAMATLSYDVWGALVVVPVVVAVSVPLLRRTFAGPLEPLYPIALVGLVAKLGGTALRYWVAFGPYRGSTDSVRYDTFGKLFAGEIWRGERGLTGVLPRGTGTAFVSRLTGTVYTFAGTSRLAGFVIFAWMGYWGTVWFVRAAVLAVPGLARRRYALMVFLAPSLLFWPSSIGKEAVSLLGLGIATYGIAMMSTGRRWATGAVATAVGLAGAALTRPHVATIWLAAMVVALVVALVTGRSASGRLPTSVLVVAALVGLFLVATFAIRYLDPGTDDEADVGTRITNILDETTRRTEQGGSSFVPLNVDGPRDWPLAIGRTLTRPFVWEADTIAEMLPAIEVTVLLGLGVAGRRRLANLPRMLATCPLVAFACSALVMFGLAFTPIGNLGILTRQRSLVLPLLLLLVCIPERAVRQAAPAPTEPFRLVASRPR